MLMEIRDNININPSPAVNVYGCKKLEKYTGSNCYENDVEMFGIMVGQSSSTQCAL